MFSLFGGDLGGIIAKKLGRNLTKKIKIWQMCSYFFEILQKLQVFLAKSETLHSLAKFSNVCPFSRGSRGYNSPKLGGNLSKKINFGPFGKIFKCLPFLGGYNSPKLGGNLSQKIKIWQMCSYFFFILHKILVFYVKSETLGHLAKFPNVCLFWRGGLGGIIVQN